MAKFSIGIRLTFWSVAILAVAELIFGASMWLILRRSLYDMVDRRLEGQVEDLKRFLAAQKDTDIPRLQRRVTEAYGIAHAGDFLELDAESGVIYRSAIVATHPSVAVPPDQVKRPFYRTQKIDERPFRFAYRKLTVGDRVYTVEMGAPADDAVETLHRFRSFSLIIAMLLT